MCYSAKVTQTFKSYQRRYGARVNYAQFELLFAARLEDDKVKIPKALEANFQDPQTADEKRIRDLIDRYVSQRSAQLEAELFKQRRRLADAERALAERTTKAATESRRIAGEKVEWILGKLGDLRRAEPKDGDSRIYPFWYAPVMRRDQEGLVVEPMRYHCRPAGKPEFYDRKFSGCYNARRDNLTGFWSGQFAKSHAAIEMTGFYENVSRHRFERRELRDGEKEENVVLRFTPTPPAPMIVACLWSLWTKPGSQDLRSFAVITDEPPPEVSAAGHDRCPVQLKESSLEAWLAPEGSEPATLDKLLDERERPFYEHRLVA